MIQLKHFAATIAFLVALGSAGVDLFKASPTTFHGKALKTTLKLSVARTATLRLIKEVAEENEIPAGEFAALVWIESRFDPQAKSPYSSASGLCQFISATGKQYGLADPFDAHANLAACGRLWKDNARYFKRRVGRVPSGSMQYLMHQQGAKAAVDMYLAGDKLAKEVSSRKAIALNLPGKNPDLATAREFVEFWAAKFNSARASFIYE